MDSPPNTAASPAAADTAPAGLRDAFAAALAAGPGHLPPGLVAPPGASLAGRFAVYRNNVAAARAGALEAGFPAACRIVGTDFFRAMALAFAAAHPPRSPVLLDYGAGFAAFAQAFPPAATVPYLADVMRLEFARLRACHAADAPPLAAAGLAGLAPAAVASLRLRLHPAAHIVRSHHPVLTIWAMNAGDLTPAPVGHLPGEDVLVLRPGLAITQRCLPPGGAAFLLALQAGETLAAAVAAATGAAPDFDLAPSLAGALAAGAFVAFATGEDRP